MASGLWRALVITHRYLGVAVGVLMLMWFVSGIVMMYVGFPRGLGKERLSALTPIAWEGCCRIDAMFRDNDVFERAEVENLAGGPVLRLRRPPLPEQVIDLRTGEAKEIDFDVAQAIAREAAPRLAGGDAPIAAADEIEDDQWTVGRYRADRPLFRFAFADPAATTLYVSGANGRILLRTTASQRFWNWLGAIPHWIYPTVLRRDGLLWSRIVIWTSILGVFLTVFGLCLGIVQLKRSKRLSPYRGLFYWHHLSGLVFGIITLTFVTSGLVSMNPWGFLDSRSGAERSRIAGAPMRWGAIKTSLEVLQQQAPATASLASAPFAGQLHWLAMDGAKVERIDAAGHAAPLSAQDLAGAAERIAGASGVASQEMMTEEDAFYFAHHEEVALPVYRIVVDDGDRTRFYLDPVSGAVLRRADSNARWHRYLFAGLHRLDFTASLRARPLWDVVMIALLLGGIGVCGTGVYLAIRRIRADVNATRAQLTMMKIGDAPR
jgi:PepSY-associated transmembrane protein